MGNLCGKQDPEAFSQPGRVLGSTPAAKRTSSIPKTQKVGGPPRTLGGSTSGNVAPSAGNSASSPEDARRKAAEAAEARAKTANRKSGGKLSSQLASQKKQTRTETLKEASDQALRAREADEAAKARNWD